MGRGRWEVVTLAVQYAFILNDEIDITGFTVHCTDLNNCLSLCTRI